MPTRPCRPFLPALAVALAACGRDELLLTHHLGGQLRSAYKFFAALPD